MNQPLPARRPNRLQGYDYAQNGAYFVTICTQDRARILSDIVCDNTPLASPRVELTALGQCVDQTIQIASRDDVAVHQYVIMPNHIHLIIVIGGQTGAGERGLSSVVRNIKSFVTKWAGFPVWQKSFYDHIIRDEKDYHRIAHYIENNPATWGNDRFF